MGCPQQGLDSASPVRPPVCQSDPPTCIWGAQTLLVLLALAYLTGVSLIWEKGPGQGAAPVLAPPPHLCPLACAGAPRHRSKEGALTRLPGHKPGRTTLLMLLSEDANLWAPAQLMTKERHAMHGRGHDEPRDPEPT